MKRNRRGWYYLLFAVSILGITLGYAYLNTELQINGTTNVSSASWNVYWNNVQLGTNNVTTVTTPATISTGKTEVSFNVDFKEPGDTYEFTVDAVNDGTIDAMISTFSKGVYASNGTTEKTLPDYLEYTVTYSDGGEIANKQLLESGKTETYKVRVHYKEDITATQLPSTDDNYMFKFSVTYAQADDAVPVDHSRIVYTVNKYDYNATTPQYNAVWLNQAIHESITQYQTPSEALTTIKTASSKDLPFYLKHKIENDVVTESYVEFVVTPEMAAANTGMTAGTYTLRGGIDESSLTDKKVFIQNAKTIYDAFGTKCSTNPYTTTITFSNFTCSVSSGLIADAHTSGYVNAMDLDGSCCSVAINGSSFCAW